MEIAIPRDCVARSGRNCASCTASPPSRLPPSATTADEDEDERRALLRGSSRDHIPCAGATNVTEAKPKTGRVEAMMVDRTPKIATLLRQKPAAEGRIQGIGRHPTEAALDALRDRMEVLRDRMEALRRDQNALRERMDALRRDLRGRDPGTEPSTVP
jgi:hypothetical protein